MSPYKTEGKKPYRIQLNKIIKFSLALVNPKANLSAEKSLDNIQLWMKLGFYVLFRREHFPLAKKKKVSVTDGTDHLESAYLERCNR